MRQKRLRLGLLLALLGACSSEPKTGPDSSSPTDKPESEPASEPATDPADDSVAEPSGARLVEPYRVRAEGELPRATLFETREAFDAGTFATAVMGKTYTAPDFAKEHVVGVVIPESPSGTKLLVQSATFNDGVITVACVVERPEAPSGDVTIQPSYVVAIPKHEGARSIVVTIDGKSIAELAIP